MTKELRHKDAGIKLTRVEDNALDRHYITDGVANDIPVYDATNAKLVGKTATEIRAILSVENGSTADQSKADIDALGLSHDSLADVSTSDHHIKYLDASAVTAAKTVKLDDFTAPDDNTDLDASTDLHGLMPKADWNKLDAIEASATADQTGAEIKTAYEGEADTNAYTDTEKTKLGTVDSNADVTADNAPKAHTASHQSAGGDPIKLDELAAPTDVATLNSSTSAHGLLKKLDNTATNFMNGAGNWAVPAGAGKSIATGSYAGNNADDRQITTGFKCSLVIIYEDTNTNGIMIPGKSWAFDDGAPQSSYLHATDGFNVYTTGDALNNSGRTYYYWAISE